MPTHSQPPSLASSKLIMGQILKAGASSPSQFSSSLLIVEDNRGCHVFFTFIHLYSSHDSSSKKASSYIAQCPVLRTVQSALHFTSLTYLFNLTLSQLSESIQPYATINARRLLVHISTTVYSQILIYTAA